MRTVLVTGGSGYFGSILAEMALARGDRVRVFDLNPPADDRVDYVAGDVRDLGALQEACDGVDVVLNNVAQVPLAKDRELFWSVNVTGTANVLLAARDRGVAKVVHTSSSAIFGIPESNPVTEDTPGRPLEAYGRAKLEAEHLCHDAAAAGLDVTIVRPRTILGHGRLGIIAVLFEFVAEGAPVYVLGSGDNRYQFVHANDLADAVLRAADREKPTTYNIGATDFGTMRETLQAVVDHAGTGSRVRSLPATPARVGMQALATVGLAPFAPYHWLLYAESLWFDTTRARTELGWEPQHSNASALVESYDWFLEHRGSLDGGAPLPPPVPCAARVAQGVEAPAVTTSRRAEGALVGDPDSDGGTAEPDDGDEVDGVSATTGEVDEEGVVDEESAVHGETPDAGADVPTGRRDRAVTLAVAAALALPIVIAAVAVRSPRWYPQVDLAQIEMRVRDVFSTHPPTIGLGGRIFGINNTQGAHPGPLSFYLLAPAYRLFGSTPWALQMSGALLNVVALVAHAVGHRAGGGAAAACCWWRPPWPFLLQLYGTTLLVYPWNPFMPVLFWVLFLVCMWGVLCGDLPLLPVAVVAGSLCAQTHIPYVGLVGGLVLVVVVSLVRQHRRTTDGDAAPARSGAGPARARGSVPLLWLPVVVQQLGRQPGERLDHLGRGHPQARSGHRLRRGVGAGAAPPRPHAPARRRAAPGRPWVGAGLLAAWVVAAVVAVRRKRARPDRPPPRGRRGARARRRRRGQHHGDPLVLPEPVGLRHRRRRGRRAWWPRPARVVRDALAARDDAERWQRLSWVPTAALVVAIAVALLPVLRDALVDRDPRAGGVLRGVRGGDRPHRRRHRGRHGARRARRHVPRVVVRPRVARRAGVLARARARAPRLRRRARPVTTASASATTASSTTTRPTPRSTWRSGSAPSTRPGPTRAPARSPSSTRAPTPEREEYTALRAFVIDELSPPTSTRRSPRST